MTGEFRFVSGQEASAPPARRDDVRLMVVDPHTVQHARFPELGLFLRAGDLIVVNTSATLPAAVNGVRGDRAVTVHFATQVEPGTWVVEVRPRRAATGPVPDLAAGERIDLPDGGRLRIEQPAPPGQRRLWRATVAAEGGIQAYLHRVGRPIRYAYVRRPHPLRAYQTVFAREPGSAEMPSAGRPFTTDLVTDLVTSGVALAPITLHTGVSSAEGGEPPQPERFAVPAATAGLVNYVRAAGGRVVAVGTTVTRALESAAGEDAVVRPSGGWTELALGPERPARVVNGLITGWHVPGTSHLDLLQAVAGCALVERAYAAAARERYLWHEFGDSCLLLP